METITKKRKEFLQDVMNEINHIKANATQEEISRLDFDNFNSAYKDRCVYGQMTGSCDSDRAKELMPKSYYSLRGLNKGTKFTDLEVYLYELKTSSETNKSIIQYLKNETQILKLI